MSDQLFAKAAKFLIASREKRLAIEKQAKQLIATIQAEEDKAKEIVLRKLTELGTDSAKTEFGTLFRAVDRKPQVDDWPTVHAHILATGNFELLQRRLTLKAVLDEVETTGEYPPGVRVHQEYVVRVRAPSEK